MRAAPRVRREPMRRKGESRRIAVASVAFVTVLVAWFGWHAYGAPGPALPLRVARDVPLSGSTSRLDYESLDAARGLLFIAHLGDGSVIAFDTKRDRVVATIPGTQSVRGVLVVPALHRVFAAAQGTGEVVAIDELSDAIVGRVAVGDVDGLAYDPRTQAIFVSDESGSADAVIDARTDRLRARVPLGGNAGNTQDDARSGHIFVAVETRDELAEIDPTTLAIVRRYPLPGCIRGHGVAIDSARRVVYVTCELNSAIVRVNLRTGGVDARSTVGLWPDVLALDAATSRLYVASESGVVTVFDTSDGGLRKIAQAYLGPNAHIVGVDERAHRLYFPLRDLDGRPVLRIAIPEARHA